MSEEAMYPIFFDIKPREDGNVLIDIIDYQTGASVFRLLFPPAIVYQMAQNCTIAAMKADGSWNSDA